jgi:DNA-binding IclR family transcriptional regulator
VTSHSITARAALLDDLATTRKLGYSVEREEVKLGITSVAAPIFASAGRLVGAMSITASIHHVDTARLGPTVITATRGLSRALGGGNSTSPPRNVERPRVS